MSRKTSIEDIRDLFNSVGLILLEDKSYGVEYKYDCKDSNGYLYKRSARTCMHTKKCKKRYSEDVDHTFSTKNPYFYKNMLMYMSKDNKYGTALLSNEKDIKNIDTLLKFRCGICGKEFSLPWHTFYSKKTKCCNYCFKMLKKQGETNTRHVDSNRFHSIAMNNGMVILNDATIKCHDKVMVQDVEGYRGFISTSTIEKNQKFEKFGKRNPYALDNLRIFAFKKKWDCVIYNQKYNGYGTQIKVLCSCGNDFNVTVDHFIEGKYKCNECRMKQSSIAFAVECWLCNNNIVYEKEKRFHGCVGDNNKVLPFDFFLPECNSCIEVDGIGHYRAVKFGGVSSDKAESEYKKRVKYDEIKTLYCKNNNIKLLRLPYWVIENDSYGDILNSFLFKSNELG